MTDSEFKRSLQREREALQTARDELKLQLHLGKAEAQKEWDKLEQKWGQVETELARLTEHAKEPIEEIGEAVKSLLGELKSGYVKIREQLKS